jgi:hypothetical protein
MGLGDGSLQLSKDVNKSKENLSIKLNEKVSEISGLDITSDYKAFFEFWCIIDSYGSNGEEYSYFYKGTEFD